ncbi:MAG: hypothetical protein N4A32_07845 [Marinifilaceae bacterium]|jgi:hypothetical protein|nr:hypothetical protein [Marinifilaceae bacterium]
MNIKDINKFILNPKDMKIDDFEALVNVLDSYPYFHLAHVLYLKYLLINNVDKYDAELSSGVLHIPDKKKYLQVLRDEIGEEYSGRFSNENAEVFKYSNQLNYQIIDYPINEIKEDSDEGVDIIDNFISKNTSSIGDISIDEEQISNEVEENSEEECLTETLAKIYIKQKLYKKAIAVYEKLSLKNPQKFTYFVSRIDEIKKIINDK